MPGRTTLWVLVGLGLAAAPAAADSKKKSADPDAVDISTFKADLQVLHDGAGHYVVVQPGDSDHVFVGDGKTLYQQRVFTSGSSPSDGEYSFSMWAPQVSHADLEAHGNKWHATCAERETPLVVADEKESRKVLDHAVFRKPLWKRQSVALGRDDDGTYYLVDRLRDEYGGKGVRLFVGPKGRMVEQKLRDSVYDTAGLILKARAGQLNVDFEPGRMRWLKRKVTLDLIDLPLGDNASLIYGELGVYLTRLGTLCDDL